MNEPWTIQLFGGLRVRQGERVISRFRTQKTGALLAYLAYHRGQNHSREVLIELFWPDTSSESGRHNLSHALSSLRSILEPPGVPAGSVIVADRFTVGLNPNAFATDAAEFERLARDAAQAANSPEHLPLLLSALDKYEGSLLPGFYEDWIAPEQARLDLRFRRAAALAIALLEREGRAEEGVEIARRLVTLDPLDEEANAHLVRSLGTAGRFAEALRAYSAYELLIDQELGEEPGAALARLASELSGRLESGGVGGVASVAAVARAAPRSPRSLQTPQTPQTPLPSTRPRLPIQFTRFFGREEEIAQIVSRLSSPDSRLLTLTGPGGTGKTRLGIEAAGQFSNAFAGEIWFVPLADLSDPALLPQAILQAMSVPLAGSREPLEQLVSVLSRRPTLLLLDNFEQLVAGGAEIVLDVLGRVEKLQCLVTSRQTLGLPGEVEYPVAPLPTPNGADTPERLGLFESVRLFVDRAQAAKPDFRVTNRNAAAVAEICDRLEGIPLAIELAAARSLVLSPSQMLAQIGNRFEFLVTRKRGISERQRTLRGTIDWSYRLLAPELQRFFARLCVFRGGWTTEAAEAVCEEPLALDMLAQLRECSMVLTEETELGIRFRMLESLREYAEAQLPEEELTRARARHAQFFVGLTEVAEPGLQGLGQSSWLRLLDFELDNLRTVMNWSLSPAGSLDIGLRLGCQLRLFWSIRGHKAEAQRYLERQLAAPVTQVPTDLLAESLMNAAYLASYVGDLTASETHYNRSLRLVRETGNQHLLARALAGLAGLSLVRGDYLSGKSYAEQSQAISTPENSPILTADAKKKHALALQYLGETAAARSAFEECVVEYGRASFDWGVATSSAMLGDLLVEIGELELASKYFDKAFEIRTRLGDEPGISYCHVNFSEIALASGDAELAKSHLATALQIMLRLGDVFNTLDAMDHLAEALAFLNQTLAPAVLWGSTERWREHLSMPRAPRLQARKERSILAARGIAEQGAFDRAWQEGRAMTMEQAVAYALEDP